MSKILRLRDDVEVVEAPQGYLLRQQDGANFTKLGGGFSVLLPLLRDGCACEDVREALIARGLDREAAGASADKIALSLEEAGLLVGSSTGGRPRRSPHLTWETTRLVPVVERAARAVPRAFFSPVVQAPWAALVYGALLYVLLASAPRLWDLPLSGDLAVAGALAALIAIWFLCHELLHGIAAIKNGCRIRSIGMRLQGSSRLSIFPFCRLNEEDVLFRPRAHVAILLAGPIFDVLMVGLVVAAALALPGTFGGSQPLFVIVAASLLAMNTTVAFKSDLCDIRNTIRRNRDEFSDRSLTVIRLVAVLNLILLAALAYYAAVLFLG